MGPARPFRLSRAGAAESPAPWTPPYRRWYEVLGLPPQEWPSGAPGTPTGRVAVVHGTRSGIPGNPSETLGTVRYCADPRNGASYHFVIDDDGTVIELAGWALRAWHATYLNAIAWGVALAQPTIDDPITAAQHRALRWLMEELERRAGVPLVRAAHETAPGWLEHRETDQGKRYGKTDVGYRLDWARLGLP